MSEALIVAVIHRYEPGWAAPADNGYEWISTWCPFHPDTNRSASVSYSRNAFHCFACEAKGDVIGLIKQQEGVDFVAAKRIAETISETSNQPLPQSPAWKSSGTTFESKGIRTRHNHRSPQQVQVGVRQRTPDRA